MARAKASNKIMGRRHAGSERQEGGEGVPQNYREAVRWLRKAADQGMALAQFGLGLEYGKGLGIGHDDAEAARWYRKAADQGIDGAQFILGNSYENGAGVRQDFVPRMN
jgi:TPR repeat protein